MTIDGKTVQQLISYAAIVMGVLTQSLNGIHLPAVASGILGVFGILLHPQTSVITSSSSEPTKSAVTVTSRANTEPVQGL